MTTLQRIITLFVLVCVFAFLPGGSSTPSLEAQSGVAIQVDAAANRRPIDPRVYGVNWASASQLAALNVAAHRWGGNSTTRHNWKSNGDNRGADWYFESIPGSGAPGAAFDDFAAQAFANGSEPMLTIPLIGWVGKNGPGGTKLASFSAAKYGAQQSCDWQWYPDACNGVRTNGQLVTGNDPNDANVAVDPQYMKEWAQHLVARWGAASSGGVRHYIYDNEPSLWHHTHRDVHPGGQTMAELRDRMIAYGTAIHEADPGAIFLGPEEWGWSGYFFSGADQKYGNETGCWSCAPDKTQNGGMDYVPWLLDQMRQHEQASGERLLHVFTLHYYPQSGEFSDSTSSSMQALRNRSTRSLWDPSYTDQSWIGDRVRLIPRMREWVGTYYPGLETGITEYSWGADGHINGATTQADILGIFGREGLNVGTRWVVPASNSPTFKAFQMYRNYNGAKSTFGDVSVRATGPNPDSLAVFAAERTSDGALTVMAINKVAASTLVSLSLASFTPAASAEVWRLDSSNSIQRQADVAAGGGTIATTLPGQSITLFVVPGASGPVTPTLSIGDVSVPEGDSGATNATFTVTLSAAAQADVTVGYATANGTASAGSDYSSRSGTLTFAAGETTQTLAVPVLGDTAIELDESFSVSLSAPTNATIGDGVGLGVIVNDDFPALSIGDVTLAEGNSGTTPASFVVTLSAASPSPVSVSYATANGTAVAPGDYAALAGNLLFSAGQTSRTIVVSVVGDTAVEPNETFTVNLSGASGATIADAQGVGTITNDDVNAPPPAGNGLPVAWTELRGVTALGSSLTKTARSRWGNGGAISTQQLAAGDGYVELTASETTTRRAIGLANGNSNASYTDIDFALYLREGQLRVYEAGTSRGSFGSFQTGDTLRVAVVGGVVQYSRNGVVFYTSTRTPVYPILVDAALYTRGATLTNVSVGFGAAPTPVPTPTPTPTPIPTPTPTPTPTPVPTPTPTPTPPPPPVVSSECRFLKADSPVNVAFCETFDAPDGNPATRAGDLNATLWGVSRTNTAVNLGQGELNNFAPATLLGCGAPETVLPPHDVRICNGRVHEAVNDAGGQPVLAMYPKQPFDIAGRTGTVVFDVSADSEGPHAAWPEFWWTDKPVPAPSGEASGQFPFARHGFGLAFGSDDCGSGTGVESIMVTRNYAFQQVPFSRTGCVTRGSATDALNHFEVRISVDRVEVWATDAGSNDIRQIATANNLGLTLTRGLIWINHVSYNACKFNNQCDHTFAWDNVGFDGPKTYRDLSFDVPDALVPVGSGMRLGYRLPTRGLTLRVEGVYRDQAPTGAIVTFNWFPYERGVPSVRVNGGAVHATPWPFDATTYGWRTIDVPIPLSEVTDGTNTIELTTASETVVSNVNLILVAGSPVP